MPLSSFLQPRDHLYKPVKNNFLACKDPICAALHSPKAHQCKNHNEKCGFQVDYADHGSVLGVVVSDNFHLRLVNGSLSYPLLAFGWVFPTLHLNLQPLNFGSDFNHMNNSEFCQF